MSDSPGDTFCHQCRSVKERRVFFFVSLSGDDHTAKSRTLLPSIIRLSFHCFCDQLSLALEKAESKRCNEKIFLPFFHIYLLRHSWVPYLDHLCGMCLGEFSFRLQFYLRAVVLEREDGRAGCCCPIFTTLMELEPVAGFPDQIPSLNEAFRGERKAVAAAAFFVKNFIDVLWPQDQRQR